MENKINSYPKVQKLKQKKEIELLFRKGKWRHSNKLRIISLAFQEESGMKFGVCVSKKYFKKAVHRNRIKRLMREAYRLNKQKFSDKFGANSWSMIFWTSKDYPKSFREVQEQFLLLCSHSNQ